MHDSNRPADGPRADPTGPTGADPLGEAVGRIDPVLERFWQVAKRLPRYLQLAIGLSLDSRVPRGAKVAVGLGGAYAVSPVDLVPGIIPVAGQLDDVLVLLLALRQALRACPPEVAAERLAAAGLTDTSIDDDLTACRAMLRWVASRSLRWSGRAARSAGRRLLRTIRRA